MYRLMNNTLVGSPNINPNNVSPAAQTVQPQMVPSRNGSPNPYMKISTQPGAPMPRPSGIPTPGAPTPTTPTPTTPTPATPPGFSANPKSPADVRQLALDLAERNRNYMNTFRSSSGYGPQGGADQVANLNATTNKAPTDMPDAYGMMSATPRGAQHELFDDEVGAQGFLQRARQFDPNAHIVYGQQNGGGGEGGTGGGMNEYYVDWDNTKLPQSTVPQNGHMTNFGAYGETDLHNQNAVAYDPHYGALTDNRNVVQPKPDMLSQMGPMAIAAIATFMSGGAASPMLISLMSKTPGLLAQMTSGNFNPTQLAGMIPGIAGATLGGP